MKVTYFIFVVCGLSKFISATPADDLNCLQVVCNFEQEDLCGYENARRDDTDDNGIGVIANQQWKLSQGMQKNRATGVRKPGEGLFYASTYLLQKDVAILVSQGRLQNSDIRFVFPLTQDRVIKFKYYKVTTGIVLKGCCDTMANCPYSSESLAIITDFDKWKTASFLCKSGTERDSLIGKIDWACIPSGVFGAKESFRQAKHYLPKMNIHYVAQEQNKIIFYGSNEGRNEGGIGLDDIQMLVSPTGNDEPDQSACQSFNNVDPSMRQSTLFNLIMSNPTIGGDESQNSSQSQSDSAVVSVNGTLLTIKQKPKASLPNNSNSNSLDENGMSKSMDRKSNTVADMNGDTKNSTLNEDVQPTAMKPTTEDFEFILIEKDGLPSSNSKNGPSRVRRSNNDFANSVRKDSFVLSSRLYLAPNETSRKLNQQQPQPGFVYPMDVVSNLKIEDLPSSSNGTEYVEENV